MKICFVVDDFNPNTGGPYTALKDITEQLKNNKIKSLIIHKKNFQLK